MAFTTRWDRGRGRIVNAFCVPTLNAANGAYHLVCFGVDPTSGVLKIWCNDKAARQATGIEEQGCNFWRSHAANNEQYMCKHCIAVYDVIRADDWLRNRIELAVGMKQPAVPKQALAASSKRKSSGVWDQIISRDVREQRFRI